MQCDYCENKATVYYTQIVEGVSKKASLCETCAAEQGITDSEAFLLGKELPSPPSATKKKPSFLSPNIPKAPFEVSQAVECSQCGFTFDDLKKTGRLGCSACYQVFRQEIYANLGSMHKGAEHKGRVPEGAMDDIQQRKKIAQLEGSLKEAIKSEDFERAVKLRDELQQLTSNTSPSPK